MKNTASVFKIILPLLGSGKATIPLVALLLLSFAGTALAQGTVFTYQGSLLDHGTNFTGIGQFKFALVTSTNAASQATATAIMGGSSPYEFVQNFNITSGGSGYVNPPAVTITGGGGSGALAQATILGGVVTGITIINPGSGYTSTPTVTIATPPANISYTTYWSNDGTSTAGSEPAAAVSVNVAEGLFTVVLGDTTVANMTTLSASLFTQPNLQLRIWFNDGVSGWAALNPAQPLTAAPYALTANSAASLSSGTFSSAVTFNNAANSFSGSGAGLTALNASQLASGTLPDARLAANVARVNQVWLLDGNAGTTPGTHFLGTTDNRALELNVNGARALRIENSGDGSDGGTTPDGAPNVIGGSQVNFVAVGVVGATISGGGATNYSGVSYTNAVLADFATVGGGLNNRVDSGALGAMIAGGVSNDIGTNSDYSAIGGGYYNNIAANSFDATIAGGYFNGIGTNSDYSAIGGGYYNNIAADSFYATIAGGVNNDIGINSDYSAIGGGYNNNIATDSFYATIAGGVNNDIGTNSVYSAIGGGYNNNIAANSYDATIAGGYNNDIGTNSVYSAIGGGSDNNIADNLSSATIAGGNANRVLAECATVPGGRQAVARDYAQMAYSSGAINIPGDAQMSWFMAKRSTSGVGPFELFVNPTQSLRMTVPSHTTWTFQILVSARSTAAEVAGYTITGVISRAADITTLLFSTSNALYESDASWDAWVSADDANDALVIWVRGNTGDNIRWVASVHTAEVSQN